MHDEKKLREISEVVMKTLKQDFNNIEFIDAKVHYDVDFEGDDILRIEVVFKGSPKKVDTTGLSSVVRHIRPKLKAIEEQAFPLFSFISDKEIKGMRVAAT
jgi:hypothetical protein